MSLIINIPIFHNKQIPIQNSMQQTPSTSEQIAKKSGTLQPVTMLLIFLIIVISQIFLISLIVILLKKIKIIIKSTARKYYYFVIFYIVSKLSLCVFLQIKIISAIPDSFKQLQSQTIEKIFDNSLVFADCSIIELFLISFEHYIALSFSIFGNKKTEKLIRILMQGAQIITFFTLMIPLLLFNINIINFSTLNLFTMSLNCLSVIAFIAAFFIMNFKMTGLMMEKRSSQIIKKVYALLLALLVSRLLMAFVGVWVQINITNGGFEDFITIIQQNQNRYVVLGFCFITYILMMLLTQGLPLIMSLRQSVTLALAQIVRKPSRPSSFQQSVITQSSTNLNQQLIKTLDMSQQIQQQTMTVSNRNITKSLDNYHGVSRIENPDELEIIQKLITIKEDFVAYKAKWKKTGKLYFVKRLRNISNYIIQQILNEVQFYKKLETKVINHIKVLQKNTQGQIYLVQKYLPQNLLKRIDKIITQPLKQKLLISIKIAKALQQFQQATKTGHGVLNPKNIMFDENQNIVLTGSGMQSLKKYLSLTSEYSNITIYTAVELFGTVRQRTISKPTKSADIYSFGIIFYEIITGNFKYRNLNLTEIRNKFEKQNTRPKIPEEISEDVKKIMRKCWQENPQNRPTISTIIGNLQTLKSTL